MRNGGTGGGGGVTGRVGTTGRGAPRAVGCCGFGGVVAGCCPPAPLLGFGGTRAGCTAARVSPPIFQGLFFPAVKPPLLWSLHLLPESCKFMAGSAGPKFLSGASRAAPHAGQARQDLDLPRGLVPPVKDRWFPSLATQLIFGGSPSPSVTSVRAEPRGVVVGVARGWPPPSHPQGGCWLLGPPFCALCKGFLGCTEGAGCQRPHKEHPEVVPAPWPPLWGLRWCQPWVRAVAPPWGPHRPGGDPARALCLDGGPSMWGRGGDPI